MPSVGRSLGLERQRRGADADDCCGRRPGAARALVYRRAGEVEQAHIVPPLAAASLTEHGPRVARRDDGAVPALPDFHIRRAL
jgi:hypothetical protein